VIIRWTENRQVLQTLPPSFFNDGHSRQSDGYIGACGIEPGLIGLGPGGRGCAWVARPECGAYAL